VTSAALVALRRWPPGGRERWVRTNFRGREVDLLAGPAAAVGALATAAPIAAAGAPGALVVTAVGSALGLYDDLCGETHARGLRGHLRALRRGRITTGLVKMAGLAAAGLVAGAGAPRHRTAFDAAVDAALTSGTANLINLLDLRPGRALKVVAGVSAPFAGGSDPAARAAAGAFATAVCLLPGDLRERGMIGDCGANGLGALAGWAITARLGRPGRLAALGVVVGLTLASERVSFSAVIERTPPLAAADAWGRLPA
jgi:hypothetical protein